MILLLLCCYILSLASLVSARGKRYLADEDNMAACGLYLSSIYRWRACANVPHSKTLGCLCKVEPYMVSVMSCFDRLMTNVTHDREKVRAQAYEQAAKTCGISQFDLWEYDSKSNNLPVYTEYSARFYANNSAFAIDDNDLYHALQTSNKWRSVTPGSHKYAGANIAYWGGIMVLRAIVNWTGELFPRVRFRFNILPVRTLRQIVHLPALFNLRHSTTVRLLNYITLNVPTREVFFILLGYFALNIGLMFGGLPIYEPNFLFPGAHETQYNKVLGVRSGYIALIQLPVLLLFAGRNNFMIWITGWHMDCFNVFHKWVGRFMFIDLIIHAASYTRCFVLRRIYSHEWSVAYWGWGISAIFFAAAIMVQASHTFRSLNYEFFLVFHIVLTIAFILGGYYHVKLLDVKLGYYYAVFAIWAFDRLLRLGRILLAGPNSSAVINIRGSDTMELTISYSGLWKIQPGSYSFIHFMFPLQFWQSHPFSMINCVNPDERGNIKMFCRVKKGITKSLWERCSQAGGTLNCRVLIDGPYGAHYSLESFSECLFIAGGIGITAPFSFIQDLASKGSKQLIYLHWAIRNKEPLEWFAKELKCIGAFPNVMVTIHIMSSVTGMLPSVEKLPVPTQNSSPSESVSSLDDEMKAHEKDSYPYEFASPNISILYQRMRVERVVTDAIEHCSGPLAVLCCGPGGINDDTRAAVSENLRRTKHYVEYFEESFSW